MNAKEKVDAFITKHTKWQKELKAIREVFNKSDLVEDFKWGAPAYTFNKKNIAGMVGFKQHLGIWFHQGVFLKDTYKKLVPEEQSTAKAMRQWKVLEGTTIDYAILKEYVEEAIENQKAGKELKLQNKTPVDSPFFKKALAKNTALHAAFKKLTPGKQNEYMEFILLAKHKETKQRRLNNIEPMILDGKGLNDKYKIANGH